MPRTRADVSQGQNSQAERDDSDDTDWIPLDPATDRGEHGLTPLIKHRLGHRIRGGGATFAQKLAQRLVDGAVEGHFRSLEEILLRIDGDAKPPQPAVNSQDTPIKVDDQTAERILDAVRYEPEGPPGD